MQERFPHPFLPMPATPEVAGVTLSDSDCAAVYKIWNSDPTPKFFPGLRVGGKISDSSSGIGLSKISDSDSRLRPLKINGIKFGCQNQWKSWCTARSLYFNECFKRNCTISTGIPNLGVWCKKRSNWTCGVGQKILLSTPTLSVVRNRTPGKNLRLRNPGFLKSENPTPVQTPATIDATELQHFLNLSSDVYKDHADSCRK